MHHLILKRILTTASSLLFLVMIPLSSQANGNKSESDILLKEYGLSEAAEQHVMRYPSTSGVDGKTPREDTAAVFLPFGVTPEGGWPVVVWAHGTVGIARGCAPSLNPRTERDKQYLNTWLSLGYAVVAPDYAGLGSSGLHHYLNARAEAWSILDGVRAAMKTFPLRNDVILVGQSQGAHAAFATAGYQPDYAPELNIRATVLTGTPYFDKQMTAADIMSATTRTALPHGDPKIPYLFYIYLSAAENNHALNPGDYFQDAALPWLRQAEKLCITPLTQQTMAAQLNADNSVKPAIESLFSQSIAAMLYPTLKIAHPVFIGIGSNDINVPVAMQKRFADAVKKAGTETEIHLYDGLDHSGTVNPSLRDSVPFVLRAMPAHH